jgi:uncharacterized protein (TIGR02646 family)
VRYVKRQDLAGAVETDLARRQTDVDATSNRPGFDAQSVWSAARQSDTIKTVIAVLQAMMGDRQRCMYCLDSHGTDIEHFWPKTPYPGKMFRWLNLLLCCAECGRFKGKQFPLSATGAPLIIDPTAENPWDHLEFDPKTGNIVARFDSVANAYSPKGQEIVTVLNLDRREAMANGYKRTWRRIKGVVDAALNEVHPVADTLIAKLREADDHGLLAWCLNGSGRNDHPFAELRQRYPEIWSTCVATFI